MVNAFKADIDLLTSNDDGLAPPGRNCFYVHTFEGRDLSARAMAEYQLNPAAAGSYHGVIGVNGDTARENDDEYIPWAAMWTGNRTGWHWSLAGRAAMSRDDWLARPKQLDKLAEVIAAYHLAYKIDLRRIDSVALVRHESGIAGHHDISIAWRESDHIDPGTGFPFDVVIDKARAIVAGKTAPAPMPATPKPVSDYTDTKYPSYLDGRPLRFSEYIRFIDYKVTKLYEAECVGEDLGIQDGTFAAASVGPKYPSYVDGEKEFHLDQYLRLIDIKVTRLWEKLEADNVQ